MKISNITFGKKIISKIPIKNIKTGQKESMNFVQYGDTPQDDFEHVNKKIMMWGEDMSSEYSILIDGLKGDLEGFNDYFEFYGIEDEDEEIQAICEVEPCRAVPKSNMMIILNMLTNPKNAYRSDKRTYSGLGASLFKKIVEFAKSKKASKIYFTDVSGGFWDKMPCVVPAGTDPYKKELEEKKYDECLRKLDMFLE